MRKLVESTYVSLDGMVSGERFWDAHARFQDDKHVAYAAKLLQSADALVLGRATYEALAASWPGRTGELADQINSLPKYVASRTLTGATWNSQILPGDAAEAVAKLKQSGEGTLLKYGTGSFSRVLLEGGQLDELHLWVYPFIAGSGEPLLPGIRTTHLDLAEVNEVGNGVVVLTYKPKRWPGTAAPDPWRGPRRPGYAASPTPGPHQPSGGAGSLQPGPQAASVILLRIPPEPPVGQVLRLDVTSRSMGPAGGLRIQAQDGAGLLKLDLQRNRRGLLPSSAGPRETVQIGPGGGRGSCQLAGSCRSHIPRGSPNWRTSGHGIRQAQRGALKYGSTRRTPPR